MVCVIDSYVLKITRTLNIVKILSNLQLLCHSLLCYKSVRLHNVLISWNFLFVLCLINLNRTLSRAQRTLNKEKFIQVFLFLLKTVNIKGKQYVLWSANGTTFDKSSLGYFVLYKGIYPKVNTDSPISPMLI